MLSLSKIVPNGRGTSTATLNLGLELDLGLPSAEAPDHEGASFQEALTTNPLG